MSVTQSYQGFIQTHIRRSVFFQFSSESGASYLAPILLSACSFSCVGLLGGFGLDRLVGMTEDTTALALTDLEQLARILIAGILTNVLGDAGFQRLVVLRLNVQLTEGLVDHVRHVRLGTIQCIEHIRNGSADRGGLGLTFRNEETDRSASRIERGVFVDGTIGVTSESDIEGLHIVYLQLSCEESNLLCWSNIIVGRIKKLDSVTISSFVVPLDYIPLGDGSNLRVLQEISYLVLFRLPFAGARGVKPASCRVVNLPFFPLGDG